MKCVLYSVLFSSVALGIPSLGSSSDTSTDMDNAIAGEIPCASNAVIFGRGTFDSGNLGVWVGPAFKAGLLKEFKNDVHVQGVNPSEYPADLPGYVEGGSETCGNGCARTIDAYAKKCPNSKIFISGWSQGGLCAWKCANRINENSRKQLKGMATFGDENALMDNPQTLPSGLPFNGFCIQDDLAPDVLCTKTLTSGIKLPTSFEELMAGINDQLTGLLKIVKNPAQAAAVAKLPVQMGAGLTAVVSNVVADIAAGKVRRWLVLPPHFNYGNNGMAGEAAKWIAGLARK